MGTEERSERPLRRGSAAVRTALRSAPADALALAMLGAGALAALGLLWLLARPPAALPAASGQAHGHGDVLDAAPGLGAELGDTSDGAEYPGLGAEPVVVHVAGKVAAPGLYELDAGARVADALEAAGGPLPDAVLEALNLARPLTDGEQLVVPDAEAAANGGAGSVGAGAAAAGGEPAGAVRADGLLDLNRATVAELQELPGIGPVLAERIYAHREEHGPFRSVGDLRSVSGIGERRFQQLADLVTV